jgi:tetratricopeptide (TPR) repeat protein
MVLRCIGVCLLGLCLGCHSFVPAEGVAEVRPAGQTAETQPTATPAQPAPPPAPAKEEKPGAEPGDAVRELNLAAEALEKGDETTACQHLARYLASRPDHAAVRAHHAELLLHLGRLPEARAEFERFADACPGETEGQLKQLIHCHSRLMEIAENEPEDEYAEHLHRGIGLFLLARQRAAVQDAAGKSGTESLLCKAAAELTLARLEHPDEARPSWYLYLVWSRLEQRQPALRYLREADNTAPFSYLSASEQTGLQLACRRHEVPPLRR